MEVDRDPSGHRHGNARRRLAPGRTALDCSSYSTTRASPDGRTSEHTRRRPTRRAPRGGARPERQSQVWYNPRRNGSL